MRNTFLTPENDQSIAQSLNMFPLGIMHSVLIDNHTITNHIAPSMSGQPFSEAHKQKLSKLYKGKKRSADICLRMSLAKKGRPGHILTEEAKQKRKTTMASRTYIISEETRARMSAAKLGKPSKRKGIKQGPRTK